MRKVFISTTSFAKDDIKPMNLLREAELEVYVNSFAKTLSEDEIKRFIYDKDFLIAGTEPLTHGVFEVAKKLKIISRCGVGMDNVDINAAAQMGIKVFNTPYGPTQSVAELTIGLILDLLRRVSVMNSDIRAGIWKKQVGNLLKGKKIGIIGFGRIGKRVAELLIPFDVDIAYFDPYVQQSNLKISSRPLEELFRWADIITLHCSGQGDGKTIISREELRKMKKGAWLINTSRGGLIDEEYLYNSLKNGDLSGAALDVFEREPYRGPLSELDNIILTPHIGSYAKEGRIEMEIQAVTNLLEGIRKL